MSHFDSASFCASLIVPSTTALHNWFNSRISESERFMPPLPAPGALSHNPEEAFEAAPMPYKRFASCVPSAWRPPRQFRRARIGEVAVHDREAAIAEGTEPEPRAARPVHPPS